jgi:ribulose-5-phosphate 4-epimerase/fuculose-1-phosphate aldolase
MLRNHGLLTVGPSIAEAFLAMYIFEAACMIQVRAQGGGELVPIPKAILDGAIAMQKQVTRGMGANLVWPGLLRRLDRIDPGFRN